jgi:hypothetical protein
MDFVILILDCTQNFLTEGFKVHNEFGSLNHGNDPWKTCEEVVDESREVRSAMIKVSSIFGLRIIKTPWKPLATQTILVHPGTQNYCSIST